MSQRLHILVKGRVQGVYFRVYTQKQAIKHGINGYVRNLEDGTVEIIAHGSPDAVQQLLTWCHKGPLLAKVTEVITKPVEHVERFDGFEIR